MVLGSETRSWNSGLFHGLFSRLGYAESQNSSDPVSTNTIVGRIHTTLPETMFRRFQLCSLAFLVASCSAAQVPPVEDQIGGALLAAPEESRDGATVLGFDRPGHYVQLREGTNELVCLADDPDRDGFGPACYHKDLDAYMARGRELRAAGVGFQENIETRAQEVEDGTLFWPSEPSTLYVLSGAEGAYDSETGTADGASLRYVVYIAYATAETTGLSETPGAPGAPWLMNGGTFRAHIMIVPPTN